jgi:hypothetical protein
LNKPGILNIRIVSADSLTKLKIFIKVLAIHKELEGENIAEKAVEVFGGSYSFLSKMFLFSIANDVGELITIWADSMNENPRITSLLVIFLYGI